MRQLHKEFPYYNWKRNKGYGTEEHRNAIQKHGLCRYHRKSFNINSHQVGLFEDDLPYAPEDGLPVDTGNL
jgi:ribonuclease HII